MAFRIRALISLALLGAIANLVSISHHPAHSWKYFFVYLAAILCSSGMKVGLPRSEGTLSVSFPFILLGILQLSPLQATGLAVFSVFAQYRFRTFTPVAAVQALFNISNVTTAAVLACRAYAMLARFHVEIAPGLAVAAIVYFFASTIPLAVIMAHDLPDRFFAQWRKDFLWHLPFYLIGAILAAVANLIGLTFGWMTSLLLIPLVYTVYRAYSAQMAMVHDREQHAIETEALHMRTIEGLAMAIEAKDQSTHEHLLRVRVYVAELGKVMGLDESLMQALLTASFLHDIGKLAVPEHIINKPGKLTREEFDKMKIHPVVGADIVERVRFPYPVVPIVRSHHEAWDGTGYPDGLKGEEIPIGARLLSVVDCFDALASERPYRKALPLEEAMAHIRSKSGTQFDPAIVDLLEHRYLALEESARHQIHKIQPLNTDIVIERGAAPGAGFEVEFGAETGLLDSGSGFATPLAARMARSSTGLYVNGLAELHQTIRRSLESCCDMAGACAILARHIPSLIPNDCLVVYLRYGDSLVPQCIEGRLRQDFSTLPISMGQGLSGWVAHNGRSIVNGNPTVEPNYLSKSGSLTATSSALSLPLSDSRGVILGALTLYAARETAFSKEHLRILQEIEPILSQALQQESMQMSFEIPLDPLDIGPWYGSETLAAL